MLRNNMKHGFYIFILFLVACGGSGGSGDGAGDRVVESVTRSVVGEWKLDNQSCSEVYIFRDDGTFLINSYDEVISGTYEFGEMVDFGQRHHFEMLFTSDNGLPDCEGDTENDVGLTISVFVGFEGSEKIALYASMTDGVALVTLSKVYEPVIVSMTPKNGVMDLDPFDSIVIGFSKEINPSLIFENETFLYLEQSKYSIVPVETIASVSGRNLTIKPVGPLDHDSKYTFSFKNMEMSHIEDLEGNRAEISREWGFETPVYDLRIYLSSISIDAFELDKLSNILYTLDIENKSITAIDLSTDTIEWTRDLTYIPSRLCVDGDRIYITNSNSNFISEYSISGFTEVSDIPWTAGNYSFGDGHFNIECDSDYLYVVDANWSPLLWEIDRSSPNVVTQIEAFESVGGLALASNGDIFTWFQYGWTAGYAGSRVSNYVQLDQGEYELVDESSVGYPAHSRNPLDSPIFVDDDFNMVINKGLIFNKSNLEQVIYDFGNDELIYSADFNNGFISTKSNVYSLHTYNVVVPLPVKNPDNVLFDADGDLYIIKNSESSMYIVPSDYLDR